MSGTGVSFGCISVINGIVNGMAAVVGIDLKTEAKFTEGGSEQIVEIIGTESTDDLLARICVRRTLENIGVDPKIGYHLTVRSEIPPSRGLKSSSSVCNAVVKAVVDNYHSDMSVIDAVHLGVECAREAKVTITGSFDDACGCEFGGLIYTDNTKDMILRQKPFGKYDVILCISDNIKIKVPHETYRAVSDRMCQIQKIAETDPMKALTLNGRLIAEVTGTSTEAMDIALDAGALAAGVSGTGPAIAIIAESGKGAEIAAKLPFKTILTETR